MIAYLKLRFSLLRYGLVSVLLSLFIIDIDIPYALVSSLAVILFIFFTLFLFRLLDDAGSFHFDRLDPSRTYLLPAHIRYFLLANVLVAIAYFGFLAFLKYTYRLHFFGLYVGSALAYLLFLRHKMVLDVLPFLKYPVIFWALSYGDIPLAIGVTLLFVIYDLLESKNILLATVLSVVAGLCIFASILSVWWVIIFIMLCGAVTFLIRNKYSLFILYPLGYFISNIFLS